MTRTATTKLEVWGPLRDAVEQILAELETRDDVFDKLTMPEVARKLLAHGIAEHRAGRGPWAKR